MWPRHILELGKQFNLMIRLQNTLKHSLQDLKTSWRCHEDVFAKRLEDVFITSWRRLGKVSWRRLENVLKTSWRRMAKTNILVLTKTSWRRKAKASIFVLIKTSWRRLQDVFWRRRRKTSSRRLQDVFIKTNVCWVSIKSSTLPKPKRKQNKEAKTSLLA